MVNLDQMEGIQICVLILLIRLVDFHDFFKCLMFFWPAEQDEVEQQEGKRKSISPLTPHPLFIIVTNVKGNLYLIWLNLHHYFGIWS